MAPDQSEQSALIAFISSWLERIERKIDDLGSSKADKSEVAELRTRVEAESRRIDTLETETVHQTRTDSARREWTRWVIPALMTMALVVVGLIQAVK